MDPPSTPENRSSPKESGFPPPRFHGRALRSVSVYREILSELRTPSCSADVIARPKKKNNLNPRVILCTLQSVRPQIAQGVVLIHNDVHRLSILIFNLEQISIYHVFFFMYMIYAVYKHIAEYHMKHQHFFIQLYVNSKHFQNITYTSYST